MEGHDTSLQITANALDGRNRHICAFFNGIDEHYRVLRCFIRDGFERGDKAFHLIDPERREEHLRRLADAGIDVEAAIASGQLEVHPWEDGPLRGERFDQDRWLAGFEEVLQSGPASGYTTTRFLAQMEWALVDMPGIDDMIEFETRVNYVVPKYDNTVICTYDLSEFGASKFRSSRRDASGERWLSPPRSMTRCRKGLRRDSPTSPSCSRPRSRMPSPVTLSDSSPTSRRR